MPGPIEAVISVDPLSYQRLMAGFALVSENVRRARMANSLSLLGDALDEVSWQWVSDKHPCLADAIEEAVGAGIEPERVRRFVMRRTQRRELALRCEQAARHLVQDPIDIATSAR